MDDFKSNMAPLIKSYVDFKRSIGYKFQHTYVLHSLDLFLYEQVYEPLGLTEEILSKWSEHRPNESDVTWYKRIDDLRNLSIYLNGIGYPSFIPRLPRRYTTTFKPYIFTEEELRRFFEACDSMEYNVSYHSLYHVCPALFRLLYGCGLRINESLSLKCDDVNLTDGFIIIHETKNGEERQLPLSGSLKNVLVQYYDYCRSNADGQDYFFAKRNGDKCSSDTIYKKFRKMLYCAGISHGGKGHGPRVHDVRHSFSVHSLANMAGQGLDLYYCLPLLSKYLGHKSLAATDNYVRLTAEMYPKLINDVNQICAFVFPEVKQP
ncbi:MAG: tyrosine-type recombinase/integrase [Clostridiales bacterium]|nr:tyrosine-type recombinase/integrase [Clostridiales bacterium]